MRYVEARCNFRSNLASIVYYPRFTMKPLRKSGKSPFASMCGPSLLDENQPGSVICRRAMAVVEGYIGRLAPEGGEGKSTCCAQGEA